MEILTKKHDRAQFDCGNDELNKYFKTQANQDLKRSLSRTYVLNCPSDPSQIIGFHTLTYGLAKSPPEGSKLDKYKHPLPALILARMAVDSRYQGDHWGEHVLLDAICRVAIATANQDSAAPVVGLFVDAKSEKVASFYTKYGFEPVNGDLDPLYLWLPVGTCVEVSRELMK